MRSGAYSPQAQPARCRDGLTRECLLAVPLGRERRQLAAGKRARSLPKGALFFVQLEFHRGAGSGLLQRNGRVDARADVVLEPARGDRLGLRVEKDHLFAVGAQVAQLGAA